GRVGHCHLRKRRSSLPPDLGGATAGARTSSVRGAPTGPYVWRTGRLSRQPVGRFALLGAALPGAALLGVALVGLPGSVASTGLGPVAFACAFFGFTGLAPTLGPSALPSTLGAPLAAGSGLGLRPRIRSVSEPEPAVA